MFNCIIKKRSKKLVSITRKYFKTHKLVLSDSKSKIMGSEDLPGKEVFEGDPEFETLELDTALSFKYLGVPLNCSPRRFFSDFNAQVKQRARLFQTRVLSLVKSGADRSELAYALWSQVALPSILYGSEVCPLTQSTIDEVEKCQIAIGKFILQVKD